MLIFPDLIVQQEVSCLSADGTLCHVVVGHDAPRGSHLPDGRLVGEVLLVVEEDVLLAPLEVGEVDRFGVPVQIFYKMDHWGISADADFLNTVALTSQK